MSIEKSGEQDRVCPPKERYLNRIGVQSEMDGPAASFISPEALILASDTTCDVDCPGPQEIPRRLLGIPLPLNKIVCGKTGSAKKEPGWD